MKTLNYIAIILLSGFITSCSLEPMIRPDGSVVKKAGDTTITIPIDNGNNNGNNGNNNGNNGNTGNTGTSNSTSYFPMTTGSTWKYKVNYDLIGERIVDITMTDEQETFGTRSFLKAKLDGSLNSSEYYHYKDNVYTLRNSINAGTDNEIPMLKEDVAVNGTWTVSYTLGSAQGRFNGTMKAKNTTHTVNGKNYTNVYYTQVQEQLGYFGQFSTVSTYNFYFAKGVGLIEYSEVFNGKLKEQRLLESYTIK